MTVNLTLDLTDVMQTFGKTIRPPDTFNLDPLFLSTVKHDILHHNLMLPYDEYNKRNNSPGLALSLHIGDVYGSGSLKELDVLLSSPTCSSMVFPREQKMADDITEYYQHKYTLNALKNVQLTQFHEDVVQLVTSKRKTLNDMEIGLIVMLPLFYEYDMCLDKIMEGKVMHPPTPSQKHKLKFLKKLTKKTKATTEYNYFFMDDRNQVYLITLDRYQKLTHFFEHFINSNEWIEINGHVQVATHSHSHSMYRFFKNWYPTFS
jgi:hypothetical protein